MSNAHMVQRPASASHDILLIEPRDAVSPKLRDALQRKGFSVKTANSPEDAAGILMGMVRPITIISCGPKTSTRKFLNPFSASLPLRVAPVIVIGKDVDGLSDELNGIFPLASTLRSPCSAQVILETINYISVHYPGIAEPGREAPSSSTDQAAGNEELSRASQTPATPINEEEPAPPQHALYSQYESIPSLFFEQLQKFHIANRELGGGNFCSMSQLPDSLGAQTNSFDPKRRNLSDKVFSVAGKWGRNHLQRVAYINEHLLAPLEISSELREAARSASSLYALSMSDQNRSLFRKEFIGRGSLLLRKELCSRVKDSAYALATEHELTLEAKIVATLAKLIGREAQVNDSPEDLVASAIMASDLTDRLCYQSGHWNPRAAHSLLRRIGSGKLRELHPAITCLLAKFLSEALAKSSPAFLIRKDIRENSELIHRARETRNKPVADHEAKITLDRLLPGMKLSQPLYAFDGKQLLEEDLTLDQDLIWRIWQLSALRPINAPVVIVRKSSQAGADD